MNDNDDDEFGDASFLLDVDLDAIEAGAAGTAVTSTAAVTAVSDTEPSTKRRKVSSCISNSKYDKTDLEKTLSSIFGYSQFRDGQLQVIQNLLNDNMDVAVFWATGSGKSLCYQIPALHTQKITLVISPLISLMQDQVHKLNYLVNKNAIVATFLGSGQLDKNQETDALTGKFLLIYLTPEKLLSRGFLQKLATLHTTHREIGLVAIDESHCISEYGHDFRPQYRKLGQALRKDAHQALQQIPIMALTATALPRVKADICQSLFLRSPFVARKSFDRTNLILACHQKGRKMPLQAAMEPLIETLKQNANQTKQQATIIYAPTRNQVEEITSFLQQRLQQETIQVEGYHAGLSNEIRTTVHTNFLTGKTAVICATVAFGLGIDKPDIRRVIHFGPPKTIEDYYQQIGRAGRDGFKAHCTMYASQADFDRYKSDFFLGGLQGSAKEAVETSINSLKAYALDSTKCRRRVLLDFFRETPSWGQRCGTCDNCERYKTLDGKDLDRNFPEARVVLKTIEALDEPSASTVLSVIGGKNVEAHRFKRGVVQSRLQGELQTLKSEASKKISKDGYQEFFSPLVQRGYLRESSKSSVIKGQNYKRTWTVFTITEKGARILSDPSLPIVLPVPAGVLEAERLERERRKLVLSRLQESGVNVDKLPQEEIEVGDGDAIRAYSKWQFYLASLRRHGNTARVLQLEELLSSLEKWRAEVAIKHHLAPGAVLAEHIMLNLAYTAATLTPGMKVDGDDLLAAGVRTRELDSLEQVVTRWTENYKPKESTIVGARQDLCSKALMHFTPGVMIVGESPWAFEVYKPMKNTGLASWESSYMRFSKGESPLVIAMSPANGRPIQVKTVCGHVMTALLHGRAVDLHRLNFFFPAPTQKEWEALQEAEKYMGVDVRGNPLNCGVGGGKLTKTDILRPIMGSDFFNTPNNERDEEMKAKFSHWCDRLEWYMTLRRIGDEPSFMAI